MTYAAQRTASASWTRARGGSTPPAIRWRTYAQPCRPASSCTTWSPARCAACHTWTNTAEVMHERVRTTMCGSTSGPSFSDTFCSLCCRCPDSG